MSCCEERPLQLLQYLRSLVRDGYAALPTRLKPEHALLAASQPPSWSTVVGRDPGYDLFAQRLPLARQLSELLGRPVDLIPEHELNRHLRDGIPKEAIEL